MGKAKADSYIFCSALMRAGEKTLLPEADLLKAAEAKDFQSAMAVIAEYGYGDGKPLANPRDFIKVLAAEEERVYNFVYSALPDREELAMLRFPKDYHNAELRGQDVVQHPAGVPDLKAPGLDATNLPGWKLRSGRRTG